MSPFTSQHSQIPEPTPTTHAGCRRRRNPERGAAMLLSSYLVSFTLLVLTTALFVRSANEMRLAERHAETQRAFWLSEAALDAALADLKTDAPPDLAVGACATEHAVPFTANTISTATYTLCLKLEDVANGTRTYSLTTTGRESGTSESLYSLVEYEQGMIEFNYAAYASDIIFFNSLSGSMDTDAQNQLIGDLTFQGDIAVWKSDNFIHTPDGSLRYDSDGNPMKGRSPVVIYKGSVINGDVYVGPDAAEPDALVEVGQGSIIRGTVKKLAAVQKLPPVEVPPDAKPLADIIGAHASDKWCLEPGTYVVENVVFGLGLGSPELCTTGSVDLYVTKRFSVPNGSLYGQPEGSRPFAKNYSPENLRIFVKGDNDILFGFGPGVGAAMLYAPTSMFQMLGNRT